MTDQKVQKPDHYMTVRIVGITQQELMSLLQTFSDENGMKFAVSIGDPEQKLSTSIELKSKMAIIGAVNPFDENTYFFASYDNYPGVKHSPSTTDLMNALHAKLKAAGGVEISVQY